MMNTTHRHLLMLAAPVLVAIAAPTYASPAVQNSGYEEAIGQAKSLMMADSAAALEHARDAHGQVAGDTDEAKQSRLTAQWLEAEALMRLNRADEAGGIIEAALAEIQTNFSGSKLHADLMRSQASLYVSQSEFGGALSAFLQAHELYEALGEDRSRAIVLQNIGSLYSDARDYERVLNYYRQANEAYPEDASLALSAHNNKGNALKELGRFTEAEAEFRNALVVAEQMESPLLEARILTNIASTQYLAGELASADATVRKGLAITDSSASEWQPFLYGVRAQVAVAQGRVGLAENYLRRTFRDEELSETSPFFRDFHDTAYQVYSQSGDFEQANRHLTAFHRIETQAQNLSSAANNALLSARFDAENRDLQIAKLSVEKEANETRLDAANNQVILLSLTVALAILAFFAAMLTLRTANRSRKEIADANAKLTHVIKHDALTQLFARDHFRTLLEEASEQGLQSGQSAILGFVDLDRFKQVNDMYGHAAGDKLLVQFAERFKRAAGEDAVIGRLGGDEFAILMPPSMSIDEAVKMSLCLIDAVGEPYTIDDDEILIGASIGLTEITEAASVSLHMTNADLALYAAKDRGRGTCVVYEPAMRKQLEDRSDLERDLEEALERGEMSISYQPIVKGEQRGVMAYEALMRWTHSERGIVPPSVFIPLAEETRLIEPLGAWMLQSACNEAVRWPDDIKLNVNISTLQMSDPAFLGTVTKALATSGLAANRLILEMTESLVLEMTPELERMVVSLKQLGVTFALDDFGCGYSSLNYIEKMDFSMIKIERKFVQSAAAGSPRSKAVVTAIVALAQSLNIDVAAEGIEEQEQADAMDALGCSCLQGYLFGRPSESVELGSDEAERAVA